MKRLALLGLCLLAGCGGQRVAAVSRKPQQHCAAGVHPVGSASVAYAAVALHALRAYAAPGGRALARFGRDNANGAPTVFGVRAELLRRDCTAPWFRAQLPLKPNGIVGWLRARDVALASVDTRVVVDVSRRRLTLFRAGRPVLTTPVAVGKTATPTPIGSFYVNQRLRAANPNGPYGPAALGVSAFSNVLTDWAQGGPIAIHGTDDPSSIGRPVSDGCVRVDNAVLRRLFTQVLAGTPVIIRP